MRTLGTGAAAAAVASVGRCEPPRSRIHLTYWEKWTGEEGEAIRRVVDQFNRAQDHIYVEYLNTSLLDRKLIVATAGGTPPDIAGLWGQHIPAFADHNALRPLDDLIAGEPGGPRFLERYYPILRDIVTYRGNVYALPTMPTVSGLYWNKTLFREAGLDPETPPRTLAEFDAFARQLTKRDPQTGRLLQVGFLSSEPKFLNWQYLAWFGGVQFDGQDVTLTRSPGNLAALEWLRGHTERLGRDDYRMFASSSTGASELNFSSPQNPFYTGRVAMCFYGVWFYSYLRRFAPGLDFGCAPWPEVVPGVRDFTHAECDIMCLPRGCRHPEAAWEFMRYVCSNNPRATREEDLAGLERLAFLQKRMPPLRDWSPFFAENHPNPQISVFRALGESRHAARMPPFGIGQEFYGEVAAMVEKTRIMSQSPAEALTYAQRRLEISWAAHQRTLARFNREA